MGNYVSIRGWAECPYNEIETAKAIIRSFEDKADGYGLSTETAQLYNRGWHFPETHINWTYYFFYGADIRVQHVSFLRDQLIALSVGVFEVSDGFTDYIEGSFDLQGQDEELSLAWKVSSGEFEEKSTDR